MTETDNLTSAPPPKLPRATLMLVLSALRDKDLRRSDLAKQTLLSRTDVDAATLLLTQGGFALPLPAPRHAADHNDIMVYRISIRGVALVQATGSLDNPFERALDKIEFIIEHQQPSRAKREAYVDSWQTLAGMGYQDRGIVRERL